ncbi:hypothetical protein [uncultured Roseibium sp.]|uniref:hypothetical protein n=1 Tax=uncultured Roseibium sp. TaxID=1936171 RepID=UPI002605C46C|nr:hypothetical protein [uncultured Roseibium sp.]
MAAITIIPQGGKPLNAILDGLLSHGVADWDSILTIDVVEGKAALLGDGEPPVERIVLTINEKLFEMKNHLQLEALFEELIAAHGEAALDDGEVEVFLKNRNKGQGKG